MMVQATDQTMGSEMLDCGTAVRMLWDYLDGRLGPPDEAAVRQHVTRCSHCFSHADFGQVVLDAVAQLREAQTIEAQTREAQAPAPSTLRDRILTQLRAEGYEGP